MIANSPHPEFYKTELLTAHTAGGEFCAKFRY
jgi:hypothetical protein